MAALILAWVVAGCGPPQRATVRVEVVQTTADLRQALDRRADLTFAAAPPPAGLPVIRVDDAVRYQRIVGVAPRSRTPRPG
jgi:hypothetical protein